MLLYSVIIYLQIETFNERFHHENIEQRDNRNSKNAKRDIQDNESV